MSGTKKTLGEVIDEIVASLKSLDQGARTIAVRAACEHLGMDLLAAGYGGEAGGDQSEVPGVPPQHVTDIRTLKTQKQPATATEMACLVAYYLEALAPPVERKREVTTADMEKYFKQAGYRLPKHMAQLLVDARASGYFDSAGRAKYKLNPVGHNLVVHGLPKLRK